MRSRIFSRERPTRSRTRRTIDAKLREESLRKLARAIQGNATEGDILDLRHSFAPLQKNEAERSLIESLPIVLEWLDQLSETIAPMCAIVLEKINRGQLLDVQRFGQNKWSSRAEH